MENSSSWRIKFRSNAAEKEPTVQQVFVGKWIGFDRTTI
jgi:hypothetical protein